MKCPHCPQEFALETELKEHCSYSQRRATEIIGELQRCRAFELLQELQQCFAHRAEFELSELLAPQLSAPVRANQITRRVQTNSRTSRKGAVTFQCPHPDCCHKRKTNFKRRKDLVRHFTSHIDCEKRCLFCRCEIKVVRTYVTHFDTCEVRLQEVNLGITCPKKVAEATSTRRCLVKQTSDHLTRLLSADAEAGTDSHKLVSAASPDLPNRIQDGSNYAHHPSNGPGTVGSTGTAAQRSFPRSSLDSIPPTNAARPSQIDPYVSLPLDSTQQRQTKVADTSTWQPRVDGCLLPSDPTVMIPPQQPLLPRAPVVLSYTMDEPYEFSNQYDYSAASMELPGSFTGYQ